MYVDHHPLRPLLKVTLAFIVIALVTGVVGYALRPGKAHYTQILIDRSPSDDDDTSALGRCAKRAAANALANDNGSVDIAQVSSAPAAMHWHTVTDRQSIWTRLTFATARRDHRAALRRADSDINTIITKTKLPPGSSDELSSLAAAAARANRVAASVSSHDRSVVMCGDGDFAGPSGSAYTSRLTATGDAHILSRLRSASLLPDWQRADFILDPNTVDRWNLPASRVALIATFWQRWASATNATYNDPYQAN